MKIQYSALLALAATAMASPMSKREGVAACTSAVTLDASTNVFKKYTLAANTFYRSEIQEAVKAISDPTLAAQAAKVADVGSFLWM